MAKKCESVNVKNQDCPVSDPYPIVLGTQETTVDLSSVASDSDDWTRDVLEYNHDSGNASTINVEGSSDVVIGPMTQFHGPVTIYQNINPNNQGSQNEATVKYNSDVVHATTAKPTGDCSPEKQPPSTFKFISTPHKKRIIIYAVIILTMLISIVVSLAVSLNATSNEDNNNVEFANETDKGNISLGKSKIFTRNQWGGRPPLNFTRPLSHPTEFVLISHTAGRFCPDFLACGPIVREIQNLHVANSKSPDIGYNFLIGGDGNVYVGRGWDIRNFHDDHNIGISFIGNYIYDQLTPKMLSALEALLNQGVVLQKLSSNYKLVCHNQTYATLSPGENVYKEMAKLPHFIPGAVVIE